MRGRSERNSGMVYAQTHKTTYSVPTAIRNTFDRMPTQQAVVNGSQPHNDKQKEPKAKICSTVHTCLRRWARRCWKSFSMADTWFSKRSLQSTMTDKSTTGQQRVHQQQRMLLVHDTPKWLSTRKREKKKTHSRAYLSKVNSATLMMASPWYSWENSLATWRNDIEKRKLAEQKVWRQQTSTSISQVSR